MDELNQRWKLSPVHLFFNEIEAALLSTYT